MKRSLLLLLILIVILPLFGKVTISESVPEDYRNTIEKKSGDIIEKELIWDNHSMVMFDYDLIPKELIKN